MYKFTLKPGNIDIHGMWHPFSLELVLNSLKSDGIIADYEEYWENGVLTYTFQLDYLKPEIVSQLIKDEKSGQIININIISNNAVFTSSSKRFYMPASDKFYVSIGQIADAIINGNENEGKILYAVRLTPENVDNVSIYKIVSEIVRPDMDYYLTNDNLQISRIGLSNKISRREWAFPCFFSDKKIREKKNFEAAEIIRKKIESSLKHADFVTSIHYDEYTLEAIAPITINTANIYTIEAQRLDTPSPVLKVIFHKPETGDAVYKCIVDASLLAENLLDHQLTKWYMAM